MFPLLSMVILLQVGVTISCFKVMGVTIVLASWTCKC